VDVYSGQAQKALYLLQTDPMLFEPAVEESLQALTAAREDEEAKGSSPDDAHEGDMLSLRKRMDEVRESERVRTVMELLYLKVCSRFLQLKAPLVKPMRTGGDVRLGSVNLKRLTEEIYSKEALALVREHLMQFAGPGEATLQTPFGSWVMIPLLQAGQVYAISAMFGYYLRQVDARYQLEKLAGSLGSAIGGDEDGDKPDLGAGDEEGAQMLKSYISSFGEAEMKRMTNIASVEARMALEAQVAALFGDLRVLKEKMMNAVGMALTEEEANEKVMKAIENKEVESLRMSSQDLQRIVLEAVAFGSMLSDSEKQVDCWYDLTPSSSDAMRQIMGEDDFGRALPE